MTQNLKNQDTANTAETTGNGENLRNPNENLTSRKWLLYLIGDRDPLLGFVHAASCEEALERVARFGRRVIAVEADPTATAEPEPMTPERIARRFELFGSIIPADSKGTGRSRTSYFYRRQAIEWAKMAREWWPGASMQPICRRLAKRYLALYRESKTTA